MVGGSGGRGIRILVVEDHEMVAESLMTMLAAEPDLEPIGSASTVREALAKVAAHRPDVVVMDFRLPDGDGVQATREVLATSPDTRVVMVTGSVEHVLLEDALDAGANGVVGKHGSLAELITAVRTVARGDAYFTSDALDKLVRRRRVADPGSITELTDRERDVLQLTADGCSPREIALRLHLSVHTVRNYLRRAMAKLDAHTKLDAVVAAARSGLIQLEQ